jgi:CDP-diacylglycerol--glycerol-3-phosphate 3-phosphatidyltransferase
MTSSTTSAEAAGAQVQGGDKGPRSIWPTTLTVTRMVLGVAIAALVLWASTFLYTDRVIAGLIYAMALMVFLIAAATDWLDGYLARKLDAVTAFGAALDHSADKVLITCVLVALAFAALPFDLVAAAIIILGRDVAVAGLREGLSAVGRAMPVSGTGKWKAAAEMAGVGAFLAYQAVALLSDAASLIIGLELAAQILLWAAALLALVSAAQYVRAAMQPCA